MEGKPKATSERMLLQLVQVDYAQCCGRDISGAMAKCFNGSEPANHGMRQRLRQGYVEDA